MSQCETSTTPLPRQRLPPWEHYKLAQGICIAVLHQPTPLSFSPFLPLPRLLWCSFNWLSSLFLLSASDLWQGWWWKCQDKWDLCLQQVCWKLVTDKQPYVDGSTPLPGLLHQMQLMQRRQVVGLGAVRYPQTPFNNKLKKVSLGPCKQAVKVPKQDLFEAFCGYDWQRGFWRRGF